MRASTPGFTLLVRDRKDSNPAMRVGFTVTTRVNRHDFGVSWNSPMDNGGVVVGSEVRITLDIEAVLEADLTSIRNQSPT